MDCRMNRITYPAGNCHGLLLNSGRSVDAVFLELVRETKDLGFLAKSIMSSGYSQYKGRDSALSF